MDSAWAARRWRTGRRDSRSRRVAATWRYFGTFGSVRNGAGRESRRRCSKRPRPGLHRGAVASSRSRPKTSTSPRAGSTHGRAACSMQRTRAPIRSARTKFSCSGRSTSAVEFGFRFFLSYHDRVIERGPLDDHGALVSGASRGVGRGVAVALADVGVRVFATGRTVANATLGERVTRLPCDHTDDDAVADVFRTI